VANAPAALRRAGLIEALSHSCNVRDEGDVKFSRPSTTKRDAESGTVAPDSLVSMMRGVRTAVMHAFQNGRFPLVIGGDCPVLLGCLAACNKARRHAGLLFVDGHEDAYLSHQSPTGEAADMELGFALGLAVPKQIQKVIGSAPLVDASEVCILGARDKKILQKTNVKSLDGMVELYNDKDLRKGTMRLANKALQRLTSKNSKRLWLHVDLDVLSTQSMPAVDYPQPGGLSWKQLEELTKTVLSSGSIIGCNVTIYNPDLDPENRSAKRIVKYLESIIE
jgi:arginase